MPVCFECPHCKTVDERPESLAGKWTVCDACGKQSRVTDPDSSPPLWIRRLMDNCLTAVLAVCVFAIVLAACFGVMFMIVGN